MMKTKFQVLLASGLLFIATIANAQTWSHGSSEIRTGIPSGGLGDASAADGKLLFYNATNSNTVTIKTGATTTTGNYDLTLPTNAGTTGDVLQNTGSGTLAWAAVSGLANVYETSVSLSATQVAGLGTPFEIVDGSSLGSGKYIEVISASAVLNFASAYSSSLTVELISAGATKAQFEIDPFLDASVSKIQLFRQIGSVSQSDTQLVGGADLQLYAPDGNPTSGSSTLIIKVMYRIVTI